MALKRFLVLGAAGIALAACTQPPTKGAAPVKAPPSAAPATAEVKDIPPLAAVLPTPACKCEPETAKPKAAAPQKALRKKVARAKAVRRRAEQRAYRQSEESYVYRYDGRYADSYADSYAESHEELVLPPPPPPAPHGFYSTARAYTVSQTAQGDAARSRAQIRVDCPEEPYGWR